MDPHAEPDQPAPGDAAMRTGMATAAPLELTPHGPVAPGDGAERAGAARRAAEVPGEGAGVEPEPAPVAPPVVAVVVTHDPGDWFEETLGSLRDQDYPNLSVLVVDAASAEDPVPRVAAVLPSAYVRRLDENRGFGAAANEVLSIVEGAAFYLFCHDDVLLEPSALRGLVEEAFRSNAGVVGPKLVAWGEPRALLQVGLSVDKTGVPANRVERGELDQEQHDGVRDVFYVPGGCMLVRADLFGVLGGFDPAVTIHGDDLDLCWRAHLAGARVLVVPSARVQHREALDDRRAVDDRRRLQARHRLRTVLTCYSAFHLVRVLPQALLFSLIEALYAVVVGRFGQARDIAAAWTWNLRRLGEVRARRRQIRALRRVGDTDLRRLQVRGSARLSGFVRGELGGEDRLKALASTGRGLAGSFSRTQTKATVAVVMVLAGVLLAGSRDLLLDRLPAMGGFAPLPAPMDLLREYGVGWRTTGLGAEGPAPTAWAVLGVLGGLVLGATGLLQALLVLGALPAGLAGIWRLTGHLGSWRARLAALVVYAAVPLPYNALARGGWGTLVLYAAAPWVLELLARASRQPPFLPVRPGDERAGGSVTARSGVYEVAALAVLLALVAAFVPFVLLLVPVVALARAAGALLAGHTAGSGRMLVIAVVASIAAVALHVPWAMEFALPGSDWAALGGVASVGGAGLSAGALLRFEVGPLGAPPLGWAVLVPAVLPLLIGRGWRLTWAAQTWTVAVACWGLAWAGGRGWLPLAGPEPGVLLAFAAAALALATALGLYAFERDLRGYGFGWRQVAAVVAAVAVGVATLPVLAGSLGGRWGGPETDFARLLTWMPAEAEEGSFRVLWVGDPEVLPVGGRPLADGLAYGFSQDGPPRAGDRWLGPTAGAEELVAGALELAAAGDTSRLGRLLAPFGIRYVATPERAAPERAGTPLRPFGDATRRLFDDQLDLRAVEVDPALRLYENTAWTPVRAGMTDAGAEASRADRGLFESAAAVDLSGAAAVLPERRGPAAFSGPIEGGTEVYLAAPAADGWRLAVGGVDVERHRAFGWANGFTVPDGVAGEATLAYRTPLAHRGALALQALLWLLALRTLLVGRVRRREEVRAR